MWVYNPQTKDLQEQQGTQGVDLSGGSVSSGGSTPNTGSAPAPTAGGPAPTSSGNFTDINKYLALNNPQAGALGQKVAGEVSQPIGKASTELDAGQNAFNQQIAANTSQLTQQQINDLAANPTKWAGYVQNGNNLNNFQNAASGQYNGPSSFSAVGPTQGSNNFIGGKFGPNVAFTKSIKPPAYGGYQDLINNIQNATNTANLNNTTGGQQQLIKGTYQDPSRATGGMLTLDQAILKGTPEAAQQVSDAASKAGGLQARLDQIQKDAGTAVTGAQNANTNTANAIKTAFLGPTGAYNTFQNTLNTQLSNAQSASDAQNEAKNWTDPNWIASQNIPMVGGKVDPNAINISDAALSQLGISKQQLADMISEQNNITANESSLSKRNPWDTSAAPTYLDNFSSYLSQTGPQNLSLGGVATQQQADELAALSQLLGPSVDANLLGSNVGGYQAGKTNFNYNDLMNYLNNEQNWEIAHGAPYSPFQRG